MKRGGKEIEKWTEVNILKPLKGKHHLAATQTLGLVNVNLASPGNYMSSQVSRPKSRYLLRCMIIYLKEGHAGLIHPCRSMFLIASRIANACNTIHSQ